MIDVTLTLQEVKYVGNLLQVDKTPISPFYPSAAANPDGIDLQRLVRAGALSSGGGINQKYDSMFRGLSGARAFGGCVYQGVRKELEFVNYFADSRAIGLMNTVEGIKIADPSPTEAFINILAQCVGSSSFRPCELDINISLLESLALAAFLDLYRKQQFGVISESAKEEKISQDAVYQWAHCGKFATQWLTGHFQMFLGRRIDFSQQDISGALAGLSKKGLLVLENNTILPGSIVALLVNRFMLVDNLIKVTAGRVNPDASVIRMHVEVVQSGFSDLLLWEVLGDQVAWQTITGRQLVILVSTMLSDAQALKPFESSTASVIIKAPQAAQSTCPNCQVSMPANAKFCVSCGSKTESPKPAESPAGKFCINCGKPIPMGGKFCIGCGKQLS